MVTVDKAQKDYEEARRILNNVARSRVATDSQKNTAKAARTILSLDFVGKRISAVNDRNAQYSKFVKDMTAVIAKIGKRSPIAALEELNTLVDKASKQTSS